MMRRTSALAVILAVTAVISLHCLAAPTPAQAFSPTKLICQATGLVSTLAGATCKEVTAHAGAIVPVGKKLLTGDVGGAAETIVGNGAAAAADVGLAALSGLVTASAIAALKETATVIDRSSRPDLVSTWFSAAYWRVAAVSALLTLPFLFAAAIQALLRSDITLLARAAFGYLPLGAIAVGIAAPVTMLLLAASDEMSSIVASASGNAGESFLGHASGFAADLSAISTSPFLAFMVGLLTVVAALILWLELLVRDAAVYVIVLMLPLFFAALVWPARRMWAIRSVELLVALILSKFAIVAVLTLGGSALGHASSSGPSAFLAGLTLVLLAAFTPWAMLRLLPLHEMASAAAGGLRVAPGGHLLTATQTAAGLIRMGHDPLPQLPAHPRAPTPEEPTGDDPRGSPTLPAVLGPPGAQERPGERSSGDAGADGSVTSPPQQAVTGAPQAGHRRFSAGWLADLSDRWRLNWGAMKLDSTFSAQSLSGEVEPDPGRPEPGVAQPPAIDPPPSQPSGMKPPPPPPDAHQPPPPPPPPEDVP